MIIDSHCHLDYPSLYDQLDNVITRATDKKIKYLLSICTTLNSFEKIKLIIRKYNNVYGTLGIHPHETKDYSYIDSIFLKKLIKKEEKIIGIGETGLDFYYNHSGKEIQKKLFLEHIKTALDLDLPVIVHTRDAEKDTFEILKSEKKNSKLKVLIHCFTGSNEFAKKLLDIGCFISISGIITFKNSTNLNQVVNSIPIDRLLVETDSPFLAPMPYRGKVNEPSYLTYTINKLSKIKKLPIEIVEKKTTENFLRIFDLK